jgi:hypothetical protein
MGQEQIFRLRLLYNISGLIYIIENDSGKEGRTGPDDFEAFQKPTILRYFERIPPGDSLSGRTGTPGRSTDVTKPELTAPSPAPNK